MVFYKIYTFSYKNYNLKYKNLLFHYKYINIGIGLASLFMTMFDVTTQDANFV